MTRSMVILDIPFGGVYAYRVNDLIENDAVTANGWEDYVEPSARSPRPPASPTSKNPKPEKSETGTAAAGGKDT